MKAPKRWECPTCGFVSDKSKTFKVGGFGFARCFKCYSPVKESKQWSEWYNAEMRRRYGKPKGEAK
jgi:uncharacterized C2H2 Zn-finger protein